MKCYELATLSLRIGAATAALKRIEAAVDSNRLAGDFLGCLVAEFGELNQILVIQAFDDAELMLENRQKMLVDGDPLGVGEFLVDLALDTYVQMPFLKPIVAGRHGPVYEVRTYRFTAGGVAPTIALWGEAMEKRAALSPLLAAMYCIDGAAFRFLHIWPYKDLAARQTIRAQAVSQGLWPPKGGHAYLTSMSSRIFMAAPFSTLA